MEPRLSYVTRLPRLPSPPGITFFELGRTWLSLYPRDELAAAAGVPEQGSGFPGFTLAHNVRSEAQADALMAEVSAAGAGL